jgi:L-threonylcarbamoyladenylate synthase
MNVLRVDPLHPDAAVLERAGEILRRGGLVAFPTETVYGLGAHALDPRAVARIYAAKGRPGYNPLIVHVADVEGARRLAARWPAAAERLAGAFWPGPLTLVVPRAAGVPDVVTAGLPSVALRIPRHPVALALLRVAGVPVAAPSANRSTEISPSTAAHVAKGLGDRVDLILDGGPAVVGIESTVLDVTGERPVLLRPGGIAIDELCPVVGEVLLPSATPHEGEARPSPGMMDRHYAPRGRVRLFSADERDAVDDEVRDASEEGERTGAILLAAPQLGTGLTIRLPDDPAGYAARLYAALHDLDDAGCALILVERVPDGPGWDGVRDRLRRAATPG